MNTDQYLRAGELELANENVYKKIDSDPSENIKLRNDEIVDFMVQRDEISMKVAEFLKDGKSDLSRYYHLMKTHKIPTSIQNPSQWLDENGCPLRGIVSCCGSPTEQLSGFVDYLLQEGMKKLGSFLKDTKHTLEIIEQVNDKIDDG